MRDSLAPGGGYVIYPIGETFEIYEEIRGRTAAALSRKASKGNFKETVKRNIKNAGEPHNCDLQHSHFNRGNRI
ncbi:hypothetical protein K040078D81_20570 [Blautia hominis]|uniref:Uncharacterized protein n=1 Tax=Blautia hominis TaxID=2025493 RepID=A0ABQ0B910_9FIRM